MAYGFIGFFPKERASQQIFVVSWGNESMTLHNITNKVPVAKQGRLIGHLNRHQNRQRQQSMLMRSIQTIERVNPA